MNNFRSETIHEQPSAVLLVLCIVKMPASLVGNSVFVKTFGCGETGFSDSHGKFSEPAEEFRKVYIP